MDDNSLYVLLLPPCLAVSPLQSANGPFPTRLLASPPTDVLGFSIGAFWMGTLLPKDEDPHSTLKLADSKLPRHGTDNPNLQAAWADFVKIVGRENVSTKPDELHRHATSDWSSHNTPDELRPFCVVYPRTTEEVSQIMQVCHKRRIPVIGYSGGTSLEGNFETKPGSISIDFHHMNSILALHKEDMDVVVQPGVGWEHLNEELEKDGVFFPPDPGPGALIGGMIGTGCSGTNAYRYGTMREWVLSVTAVLADGTIIKTRQRPRKSSAGYDLTKLFVGSEGTLGLVTEATLKLAVIPEHTSVAVASFGTIRQAADTVSKIVSKGVPVAAVEILDDAQMKCINDAGFTSRTWREKPTLFFKFTGTKNSVKEQIATAKDMAKRSGGESFEFAKDKHEQHELWSARKEALWSTMAQRNDGEKIWTGDVAVPVSRLPDIIEETKEDMKTSGMFGTIVGHVGDGNFHCEWQLGFLSLVARDAIFPLTLCQQSSSTTMSRGKTPRHWWAGWLGGLSQWREPLP